MSTSPTTARSRWRRLRVAPLPRLRAAGRRGAQGRWSSTPTAALSLDLEALLGRFADASWAYRFGPPAQDLIVASIEREGAGGAELLSQAVHLPAGRPSAVESADRLGLELRAPPGARRGGRSLADEPPVRLRPAGRAGGLVARGRCVLAGARALRTVNLEAIEPEAIGGPLAVTALNMQGRVTVPLPAERRHGTRHPHLSRNGPGPGLRRLSGAAVRVCLRRHGADLRALGLGRGRLLPQPPCLGRAARGGRAPDPALRLPATGNSAGTPADPDRVESWVAAVCRAAEWLRETTRLRAWRRSGSASAASWPARPGQGGAVRGARRSGARRSAAAPSCAKPRRSRGCRREGGRPGPRIRPARGLAGGGWLRAQRGDDRVAALARPRAAARLVPAPGLLLGRDGIGRTQAARALRAGRGRGRRRPRVPAGPRWSPTPSAPASRRGDRERRRLARGGRWTPQPRRSSSRSAQRRIRGHWGVRSRSRWSSRSIAPMCARRRCSSASGSATPSACSPSRCDAHSQGLCAIFLNAGAVATPGPTASGSRPRRRWAPEASRRSASTSRGSARPTAKAALRRRRLLPAEVRAAGAGSWTPSKSGAWATASCSPASAPAATGRSGPGFRPAG